MSGTRLWNNITKIDYDCRPASRKRDSKENFMQSLYVAFTQSNYEQSFEGRRFDYDLTISDLDNQLSIVLKEQLAGTSTLSLLFKDTFISKDNSDAMMNQLWIEQIGKSTMLEGEVKKKEMLLTGYKEDNKILIEKIQSLENDRYQNVTSLFNPLKRENQRLRNELEAGVTIKPVVDDGLEEELEDLPRTKRPATTKVSTRKPAASKGKSTNSAVDSILQKVKKATASSSTARKPPAKRGRKSIISDDEEEIDIPDDSTVGDETEEEVASVRPLPTIRESNPKSTTPSTKMDVENEDDDDITVIDSDEEQDVIEAQPANVWSMASVKEPYSFPSSSFLPSSSSLHTATAVSSSSGSAAVSKSFASSNKIDRDDAESPVLGVRSSSFSQSSNMPSITNSFTAANTLPPTNTTTITAIPPVPTTIPPSAAATAANSKKKRSNRFFEDSDDD